MPSSEFQASTHLPAMIEGIIKPSTVCDSTSTVSDVTARRFVKIHAPNVILLPQSIQPPPPSSSSVKPSSSPITYLPAPWPFSTTSPSASSGACNLVAGFSMGSVGSGRRGYVHAVDFGGIVNGNRSVASGLRDDAHQSMRTLKRQKEHTIRMSRG